MKNSELDEDKDNAIIAETVGVGLQSILDGRGTQNNKGFVNLTGRVIGNGNGSIHVTIHNVRNYYSHPQPLLPSHEQSKEHSSGANLNLLKHDQLDNANKNGISLSKSSSSSLSTTCMRRAVLCGVTYGKRKFRLKGTINDVVNMKELLIKNFGFPIECIRVLTEEQHDPNLTPTRRNILESLKWLVKYCRPGDSLVFYFSGHGLRQPDFNGDEIDSFDETLCPVDFMTEGMITDDEINSTIVWPLKMGVTLHAIIDAGYSGTILDLSYVYDQQYRKWKDYNKPSTIRKHTSGGLAICLGACEDSQMAADSKVRIEYLQAFGPKRMNGVFTCLLTKTIRDCPAITYGSLLDMIHREFENINGSNSILKHIFQRKVSQDPLLSSSQQFDVYKRIFTM